MQNKIESIFEDSKEHRTERLTLKPHKSDDLDIYSKIWTNEQVLRYIPISPKKNEEDLKRSFNLVMDYIASKGSFRYTIYLNETNVKIGYFAINAIDRVSSRVNLGCFILPEYWNKGILTEIIEMMLKYLFDEIELNKICTTINYDNIAARKVLEKSGFRLEALLKKHDYVEEEDKYSDVGKYGVLREKFGLDLLRNKV
jgi:RimJ/RimL family protein N-acetyltransferase